jgi:hypothetical protein
MLGRDVRDFIPLHLDPMVAREEEVGERVKDITRGLNFEVLEPSGWFDDAHEFVKHTAGRDGGGSRAIGVCSTKTTSGNAHCCCTPTDDGALATASNTRN